jgi:hypothetical protein
VSYWFWGPVLGLLIFSAVWFTLRVYVTYRMAQALAVGVKLGRAIALTSQDQVDQMLIDAGLDPAMILRRDA